MKRVFIITIVSVIVLVSIIILGIYLKGNFSEEKKMNIKVGFIPIGDCLQIFVAQEKGFFEGEGLEVEAVSMAGGAVITPAVESGELDIGFSNTISIIIAHEQGSDFKFMMPGDFFDSGSAGTFQLLVATDSSITEPKDLEGKKVAVNTFANIMELGLRAWADKNNVDFDTLEVVEVPFPQMESALENKEIDSFFSVQPFATLSVTNGVAKVLDGAPMVALSDRWMVASWFAKESWIDENPEKAQAFMNAMNRATEYIIENPGEMPFILSQNSRTSEEVATQITLPSFKETIEKQDLQVMIDNSHKYGYITEKFDASEIAIDNLLLN